MLNVTNPSVVNPIRVGAKLYTNFCVNCSAPAKEWSGHVKAHMKMALGNMVPISILAGWCCMECHDKAEKQIAEILENNEALRVIFKHLNEIGPGFCGFFDESSHGGYSYELLDTKSLPTLVKIDTDKIKQELIDDLQGLIHQGYLLRKAGEGLDWAETELAERVEAIATKFVDKLDPRLTASLDAAADSKEER